VIGEVIRFLHFDFRQHYFDMPETPVMFLAAAAWSLVYGVAWIFGIAPHGSGIEDFTYRHLPLLFEMVRAWTFVAGLVAIVLVYLLASKLTNRAGACVAALLFAMCPIYAWTESTIRPEPGAVCLFIGAIFCMLRALERGAASGWNIEARWIFASGALAGLAGAMRFHSITASLPLLLMIAVSSSWPAPKYPEGWSTFPTRITAFAFAAALAAMGAIKAGLPLKTSAGKAMIEWWPKAFDAMFTMCFGAAMLIAAIWALGRIRATAWIAERAFHPRVFLTIGATIAGVLAGTPTVLWRPRGFFDSIQMYTTAYVDVDRMSWPVARHLAWIFSFYLKAMADDKLSLTLIGAGAALILIRRDRRMLPFLITAALFFISRPLNTAPWPHQMILWLPLTAIVAGYGVAAVYDAWKAYAIRDLAVAALLLAMLATMHRGPALTAAEVQADERRMASIAQATDWIHRNTEPGAAVAVSFYCFNSDVFLEWMRIVQTAVPAWTADGRRYVIWWGKHSQIKDLRGYACATPADVDNIKRKTDLLTPGEGSDPFSDPGFKRVQAFGRDASEVDVFRFDFSGEGALANERSR